MELETSESAGNENLPQEHQASTEKIVDLTNELNEVLDNCIRDAKAILTDVKEMNAAIEESLNRDEK